MFAYKECLTSLKYLAKLSPNEDKSHCQKLDICSQEFGFNNYLHFKTTLPKLPKDRFGKFSLKLMRKYCEVARPSLDQNYVEFYAAQGRHAAKVSFYSHWIGWDRLGREVREPRPYDGKASIDGVRELFRDPVYVVENSRQLLSWLYSWYGTALIPEQLARELFPGKFNRKWQVCDDVNFDLVKNCKKKYDDNIAS